MNGVKGQAASGGMGALVAAVAMVILQLFGPGGTQSQQEARTAAHAQAIDDLTRRAERGERAYEQLGSALAQQQRQITELSTLITEMNKTQDGMLEELAVLRNHTNRVVGWVTRDKAELERKLGERHEVSMDNTGSVESE